jgi:hypothetical protein
MEEEAAECVAGDVSVFAPEDPVDAELAERA